jgi:hypothetical protein
MLMLAIRLMVLFVFEITPVYLLQVNQLKISLKKLQLLLLFEFFIKKL